MPTAPPRLFPGRLPRHPLATRASITQSAWSRPQQTRTRRCRAARMDIIVGVAMASVVPAAARAAIWCARVGLLPVMSTGNHYWLDSPPGSPSPTSASCSSRRTPLESLAAREQPRRPRVGQLDRVEAGSTQPAARGRSCGARCDGVARTKLTPDMLTLAGLARSASRARCSSASRRATSTSSTGSARPLFVDRARSPTSSNSALARYAAEQGDGVRRVPRLD